jgi:flagellar biosynthesis/type III secretory pathway chaperone
MKNKKGKPVRKNPHVLEVPHKEGKTNEESMSAIMLRPECNAALTMRAFNNRHGTLDVMALLEGLNKSAALINKNDFSEMEAYLNAQAQVLDAMFHNLAARAMNAEYIEQLKSYFSLALKAQNQSRMTWETLAQIKNPTPYVRQQNLAYNQQVNNGNPTSCARVENSKSANELLEDKTHEYQRLDTRAPQTTGRSDKELETVGAFHGCKKP